MDFFEAQDQAQRNTKTLVALFALAVVAMGALIYLGVSYALILKVDSSLPLYSPKRVLWILGSVAAFVAACSLWKIASLKEGGSSIALMLGGTKVAAQTDDPKLRRYRNVVEEMAIASGLRIPEIFILKEESGINAFAAGYTPQNAAVAVSQGCLDQLDRDELQGVVAHEFSHILNGDMRLNTRLIGVLFGLLALGMTGRAILRGSGRRGRVRSSGGNRKGGGGIILLIALIIMLVGYVGVFFGRLIQSAISRQREYLADASAVQFTRNPGGIANALRKIQLFAVGSRIEHPDALEASHLFFSSALSSVFATHPPLTERIKAIDPKGLTLKKLEIPDPRPARTPSGEQDRQNAETLVSGLGAVDQKALQQAQSTTASLPEELSLLARNPSEAALLLLATLGTTSESLRTQNLSPNQKHALFEIALATIKELPPHQLETQLSEIRKRARGDGKVDFNEQCLLIAIERSLQNVHSNSSFGRHSFPQSRTGIETVLSAIALVGASSDAQAEEAFLRGSTAFNAFGVQLAPRFEKARDAESLHDAINQTVEAIMPVRKAALVACIRIIAHDDHLSDSELSHVRSLCAAMDCPLPPLSA